jgi:molybdopterin-containing oxidoreductase family membrane subunit
LFAKYLPVINMAEVKTILNSSDEKAKQAAEAKIKAGAEAFKASPAYDKGIE